MKLSVTSLLALLAITPAVSAQTLDDAIASIGTLATRVTSFQSSIDGFNGGVLLALPLANSLYTAHTAATTVRTQLTALPPLSAADSQRGVDAYNELHPRLISALASGRTKAQVIRDAGISYVAQGMLANLYNEKNRVEAVFREKVDPTIFREDLAADVDTAFRETMLLF